MVQCIHTYIHYLASAETFTISSQNTAVRFYQLTTQTCCFEDHNEPLHCAVLQDHYTNFLFFQDHNEPLHRMILQDHHTNLLFFGSQQIILNNLLSTYLCQGRVRVN